MKNTLKISTLMVAFFVMISSVASAAWATTPVMASETTHLIVIGVGLIATGCLLRERKSARSATNPSH